MKPQIKRIKLEIDSEHWDSTTEENTAIVLKEIRERDIINIVSHHDGIYLYYIAWEE